MTLTTDELNQAFLRLLTPAHASGGACETPGATPGGGVDATASSGPATSPSSPAPALASVPLPPLAEGACRVVDARARGYHFEARVAPGQVVEAGRLLDGLGFSIDAITGVDWLAAGEMEVVYDFFHPASPLHGVVRCRVSRDGGEVPTLSGVYPGADWHEREAHDFFGIRFVGHPDLGPFLLPEDADYHPLRKDFAGVA
jgi:NADH-quinone oxidoreductase subunit C